MTFAQNNENASRSDFGTHWVEWRINGTTWRVYTTGVEKKTNVHVNHLPSSSPSPSCAVMRRCFAIFYIQIFFHSIWLNHMISYLDADNILKWTADLCASTSRCHLYTWINLIERKNWQPNDVWWKSRWSLLLIDGKAERDQVDLYFSLIKWPTITCLKQSFTHVIFVPFSVVFTLHFGSLRNSDTFDLWQCQMSEKFLLVSCCGDPAGNSPGSNFDRSHGDCECDGDYW